MGRRGSAGLTEREAALLNDNAGSLGLVVRSGRVYASGMDIPGEPTEIYARHGAGGFVDLPPGVYDVILNEIDLDPVSEPEQTALPDFVAMIRRREAPFAGVRAEPAFYGGKAMALELRELEGEQQCRGSRERLGSSWTATGTSGEMRAGGGG